MNAPISWQGSTGTLAHLKNCDLHRNNSPNLVLCCCIVLFTERHDVHTLQTVFCKFRVHSAICKYGPAFTFLWPAPNTGSHRE